MTDEPISEEELKQWALARSVVSDEVRFTRLADAWKRETEHMSRPISIVMHPAYQAIIGMGVRAVPLILDRLEREANNPDHWHVALCTITGANPVPKKDLGDTRAIARAWRDWANGSSLHP